MWGHARSEVHRGAEGAGGADAAEARPQHESEWAAIASVASKIGASAETVRKWGCCGRSSSAEESRRRLQDLIRPAQLGNLPAQPLDLGVALVRFIEEHKDRRVDGGLRWGVEPICEVLSTHRLAVAPATYYAAQTRPPSARARREAMLTPVVEAMHRDNYGVYGVRKMTAALKRAGVAIGRDQTGRLMRELGLVGTRRGHGETHHGLGPGGGPAG